MKKKVFISVIILILLMFFGIAVLVKMPIVNKGNEKVSGEVCSNESIISNVKNKEIENVAILETNTNDPAISKNTISTEENEKTVQEEAKAETKTEAKAETKTEAKAETKTEAKAETKTEAKAETKTEAKAETKAETKTEAKAETKAENTQTKQGNKELANTTYRKVNTEVVPGVINILNDEIGKHDELKKYNTRAIKGTKQQVYENTTGFTYMFVKDVEKGKVSGNYIVFEQRIRNTVGAGGKYYVYAEDEYVYDSTGSKSYWTQTLVWVYITF